MRSRIKLKIQSPFKSSLYDFTTKDIDSMKNIEVVRRTKQRIQGLRKFWSHAEGWAPQKANDILKKVRLDWLVSLTDVLKIWQSKNKNRQLTDGELIIAWVNLGSIVEGVLKLFLTVHYEDYINDRDNILDKHGNVIGPEELQFEKMRQFFNKKFWRNNKDEFDWNKWILHIQQRRNVIHAYKSRDIGDTKEFLNDLKTFLKFLRIIDYTGLPYPDENYMPCEE